MHGYSWTMRCYLLLPLLPAATLALQFPFKVPFLDWNVSAGLEDGTIPNHTPRIAIIGAGAGGSSAAFWISKAKERYGVDVQVDVYEKETYIGGRTLFTTSVQCEVIVIMVDH